MTYAERETLSDLIEHIDDPNLVKALRLLVEMIADQQRDLTDRINELKATVSARLPGRR
jgi:hypothetical protein